MLEDAALQRKRSCISGEQMEISSASLSGVPLLRVVGDVDHHAAAVFDEAARDALAPDCGCLLLDLSDCPYLDSGGLGVILTVFKDIREGGWVGVIGPNPNVRRLLELVGLIGAESFLVFGDEEEAATLVSTARLDDYSATALAWLRAHWGVFLVGPGGRRGAVAGHIRGAPRVATAGLLGACHSGDSPDGEREACSRAHPRMASAHPQPLARRGTPTRALGSIGVGPHSKARACTSR